MNYLPNIFQRVFSAIIVSAFVSSFWVPARAAAGEPRLTEDQKILHVLNRLGYGARPGDVEKVRAIGLKTYIEQQLAPEKIDDKQVEAMVERLEVFDLSTAELFAKYPNPGALLRMVEGRAATAAGANEATETQRSERQAKLRELYRKYDLRPANQILPQIVANRVLRAAYSERQLQEVMVDFWQNHFNVFSGKAAVRWYIPSYERDVLRKYALGNFKDLVAGTAQHPAMLFFLDNFESRSPASAGNNGRNAARLQQMIRDGGQIPPGARQRMKRQLGLTDAELDARIKQMRDNAKAEPQPAQQARRRAGINENYARELMELHTLGVDGGYSQKDIVEVARAFTGWTIADPRGYRRAAAAEINGSNGQREARLQRAAGIPEGVDSGEFYFNERWHEKGAKSVLGQTVNEGGVKDGLKVIDLLVAHPSTARFIARKLAVKFVNDTPSEELVNRVAAEFSRTSGDIRSTLRVLFNDKAFFAPENYRAKIKTPFELAVSSVRALGAKTTAGPQLLAMLNKLGEVPYGYQAPTGYPDTAEDWVNTGALLERLNFAVAVAGNRIPGTRADLRAYDPKNRESVLDRAIAGILGGEISNATRASLLKQMRSPLPDPKAVESPERDDDAEQMTPAGRRGQGRRLTLLEPTGDPEVVKAVSLVLGSPEFQRQ